MHATIIALEHVFCIQNAILNSNFGFECVYVPFSIRQFSMVFFFISLCIITYRVIAVLSRQDTNNNNKNEWMKNSWEFFKVCGWGWWKANERANEQTDPTGRRKIICLSKKKSWRYLLNIYVFKLYMYCISNWIHVRYIFIHHWSCVADWCISSHQSALTFDAAASAATL